MALNAKTGQPVPGFGNEGWVDMKAGIQNGFATGNFSLPSPPKVFKNVVSREVCAAVPHELQAGGDRKGHA
jgi:glucose dehydrogenase